MSFRLVPLGGLGEIGMNCMAIEIGTTGRGPLVIVDCGVTFPTTPYGIELIHPDFRFIDQHRDRIAALVVTHGHEDHIGAIPYLLKHVDLPIHAPPYALGLIRERLKEHTGGEGLRLHRTPDMFATKPRVPFTIHHGGASFEIEPIRVTHSIADATALAIRGDGGTLVHTGDFKIDPDPTDGEAFDKERLAELGREGVSVLLSDSTNVDSPGFGRGERVVADALYRAVEGAPGRVIIGLFASNVHRLRALSSIARRVNRKIVLVGRSVQTHVRVAQETGYLAIPGDLRIGLDDAQRIPPNELLVLATGSQAEPRAALARLALDDHPRLRLSPGDRVILSARAIPGNEIEVMRMVADFHRRGCEVVLPQTEPEIHASGHAHRGEQREVIDLVQPRAFVPVHGTRHHLEQHAKLAREAGVPEVLVMENGETADADPNGLRKSGVFASGRIAVHASYELSDGVIRERKLLGELGVIMVSVVVDKRGRPLADPKISTRGIIDEVAKWEILIDARDEVRSALEDHPWVVENPSDDEIREIARLAARRAVARHVGGKPVAVALVQRADRTT